MDQLSTDYITWVTVDDVINKNAMNVSQWIFSSDAHHINHKNILEMLKVKSHLLLDLLNQGRIACNSFLF